MPRLNEHNYVGLMAEPPSSTYGSKGLRTTIIPLKQGKLYGSFFISSYWKFPEGVYGLQTGISYAQSGDPNHLFMAPAPPYPKTEVISKDPPMVLGVPHTYSIELVTGTLWDGKIDGQTVKRYDMKVDQLDSPITVWGECIGHVSGLKPIVFNPALEYLVDGAWTPVASAKSRVALASPNFKWGIEGMIQNSTLQRNHVRIASSIGVTNNFTQLW